MRIYLIISVSFSFRTMSSLFNGSGTNYQNGNTVGDPTAIPPISPKVSFGFALATVTDTGMTIQYYSLDAVTGSWSVAAYKTLIPPLP